MKTRLVRIGNSRGLRLPKSLLDQLGLEDEVELRVADGALIVSPSAPARAGWADAAAAGPRDGLLDAPTRTRFDDAWTW